MEEISRQCKHIQDKTYVCFNLLFAQYQSAFILAPRVIPVCVYTCPLIIGGNHIIFSFLYIFNTFWSLAKKIGMSESVPRTELICLVGVKTWLINLICVPIIPSAPKACPLLNFDTFWSYIAETWHKY